ncbi:ATP-binding cassette domain-containing protein [Alkalicella caledoniensis]|uniref:ATP-binding cassette domain-containing protein n=1 Tax=Alkalicella caledoniensis TaxID=2731377 RepID=A0A7G9WAQ0_ALKCA|nr:ATP-binding cassette domain-containing protein [Alkalicella caledoniensis]QNO15762.1 ATP-binding cassette domain-containing protein [Alkalicella caledoniensis]
MNLSILNLTRIYNDKKVLDLPKANIKSGSIYSIIGPNGAGKSTLIRILAGIDNASSGKVLYNDSVFDDDVRKRITLLFQKPYMMNLNVYENIAYPLKIRGFSKWDIGSRVDELLGILDLHDIKSQRASTLSGGEAQKVALARGLVFRPELVLLDEPTASIDPVSTLLMEKLVTQTNKNYGTTFVWVTHNISQARRTADKVIFMHQGKVVESGGAEMVLKNPTNEITRRFVGGDLIL